MLYYDFSGTSTVASPEHYINTLTASQRDRIDLPRHLHYGLSTSYGSSGHVKVGNACAPSAFLWAFRGEGN